jgi:hypothetical protein
VRPEFVATFESREHYLAWRRRPPRLLKDLLAQGERAQAQEAAEAFGRFFDAAIAEDWPRVSAVLDADIAYRADLMTTHGLASMHGACRPVALRRRAPAHTDAHVRRSGYGDAVVTASVTCRQRRGGR